MTVTDRNNRDAMQQFILHHMKEHPADIVKLTTKQFDCSRQAVHKRIQGLEADGLVISKGATRNKRYHLRSWVVLEKSYALGNITEDRVWGLDIAPLLVGLPENALTIWQYGLTEMFNNAIDHSGGTSVSVRLERTAISTQLKILDNGTGIFKKIQSALGLWDERHAVLELAKGKLTTDPDQHSGEGVFFSSRMFDAFFILSGGVCFSHQFDEHEDWILQSSQTTAGTLIHMELNNNTDRTAQQVFGQFTVDDDYGFTKTVVPVRLVQYGDANLISRSQARRMLVRFDRFKVVVLDFSGVSMIGQAFADEVFRVFRRKHPQIELVAIHTCPAIQQMISRAGVFIE